MDYFQKTLYMIASIAILKVIGDFILKSVRKFKSDNLRNKLTLGLASRKDLTELTGSGFILWCTDILANIGFSNIQIVSRDIGEIYQIIAYINGQRAYIKCVKLRHNPDFDEKEEDEFLTVGRPDLQKLVGAMEKDQIKICYVLTNGDFSSEARDFAATMPLPYSLKIIDGCELTRLHRLNQEQYLTAKLD